MNVVTDPWIPVIRTDGTKDIISPFQITGNPNNPVLHISCGRPDFDAAVVRMLIGLFNTFIKCKSKKEWKAFFYNPPKPEEILLKFKSSKFFELDGEGPRFLQDKQPGDLDKIRNVGNLLFDTPGSATVKAGKDFFIKAKIHIFCPTCATIALYIAQYSAIMGGMGYRTGITSGANGALATFITGKDLWETIWSNVIIEKDMYELGGKLKGIIFPWMSNSVNSKNKATVSLDDVNPYYPLWEMPLRIYLLFEKNNTPCTVCGSTNEVMVQKMKIRNYGNCYIQPRHIFSSSKHSKTKGISFRKPITYPSYAHLMTYLFPTEKTMLADKTMPAEVVTHFINNMDYLKPNEVGLWTFGFSMEKAKLFAWEENRYVISDLIFKNRDLAIQIAQLSNTIGWYTCSYIRRMWTAKSNDLFIMDEFMRNTEENFYKVLETNDLKSWLESMVIKSFDLLDRHLGTQKPGLQRYFKEQFIEIINKKIVKPLELEELDFQDFIHIEYRKLNLPHFKKEFTKPLLSWIGKIYVNHEHYRTFHQEDTIEGILSNESYINLVFEIMEFYPKLEEPDVNEKLAAALLVIFQIKEMDFSNPFPAQIALNGIIRRNLDEILSVKDVVKEWKVFKKVINQLDQLNVISFLEGFMFWSPDVRIYWEKEYIKNI